MKRVSPMLTNFRDIYKNLYEARDSHNDQYLTFVNYLLPEYERTCLVEYSGNEQIIFSKADNKEYDEIL